MNTSAFPTEFQRVFLQALLDEVSFAFTSESQARNYRTQLYKYRKAYIAERLPYYDLLPQVISTIEQSTALCKSDKKRVTYTLTLSKRKLHEPLSELPSLDTLQEKLGTPRTLSPQEQYQFDLAQIEADTNLSAEEKAVAIQHAYVQMQKAAEQEQKQSNPQEQLDTSAEAISAAQSLYMYDEEID